MPSLIVTGAHGFIGNNILESLLKADPESLGLAKRRTPKFSDARVEPEAATAAHPGTPGSVAILNVTTTTEPRPGVLDFFVADLPESLVRSNAQRFLQSSRVTFVPHTDLKSTIESLDERPIAIIHNGACSSTVETDPNVFATLNLGYSQMVWDLCTRMRIPLIYASSAAVYGDGEHGFSDNPEANSKYRPLNLYGKSKLDFDIWALQQKQTPPTWFGLRYFNVFGPFESHKGGQASMVYHAYNQITKTGKVKLFRSTSERFRDGYQERDFVYVKDVVKITLELLRICIARSTGTTSHTLAGNGRILNIGRGVPETWNTLTASVFDALQIPTQIEYIDMPEPMKKQYQNHTCAELSSLRELGVDHRFADLRESVGEYVRKYLLRRL